MIVQNPSFLLFICWCYFLKFKNNLIFNLFISNLRVEFYGTCFWRNNLMKLLQNLGGISAISMLYLLKTVLQDTYFVITNSLYSSMNQNISADNWGNSWINQKSFLGARNIQEENYRFSLESYLTDFRKYIDTNYN